MPSTARKASIRHVGEIRRPIHPDQHPGLFSTFRSPYAFHITHGEGRITRPQQEEEGA
ncbi:hypothetical protein SVEN_3069 [Streptomyces venezuelae ATCC 10712]|uniref:Uncharacterized protein n=1 Tax=Streptomyces venezuelae (strain ATCC 10712 / CBS 650.69 / DSM 40230 / JCM 4526 / NBRC 13096 / PD 04745) TaxID=953739 RepID=F2R7S0_STRVP|nr:hypothetical protein SVEN_3069 [Streptomyces venezuelae ATCC 10712]